jgi:hypothetical protein
MIVRTTAILATAMLLGAAGPLQPQTVEGPCQVKPFFIVGFGTSNTDMAISAPGQACTFTVINPDLQAVQSGALVTTQPTHGRAEAGLILGGTSAAIRYTPAAGYIGTDRFTATIEPNDKAVIVSVTVGAKP